MNIDSRDGYIVAIVGAGPAGLFAAKELANEGISVVVFNRDIKPGGLAEYGIHPNKIKMKESLRAQFRQILSHECLSYYGNLKIGQSGALRLDELRDLGFQTILVATGAQGTKRLGLPGEDLSGVYHAKDIVYHYNLLPPYSQQEFHIGRRVAIVGAGNVMLDIAHHLINVLKVDEVIALARRGPGEIKFNRKEMERVAAYLDLEAEEAEIERSRPLMLSLGKDPEQVKSIFYAAWENAAIKVSNSRFTIRFLYSPVKILGDAGGHVTCLELEENTLVLEGGEVKARGLGVRRMLDVDTVIFAIGDQVDQELGLPVQGYEFFKNPNPRYPVDGLSYELCDYQTGCELEGVFVAGWSREASKGLVGVARKDGSNGARVVKQHLATLPPLNEIPMEEIARSIAGLGVPVVTKDDLQRLERIEQERARQLGLQEFKFATNQEMLEAIGLAMPLWGS